MWLRQGLVASAKLAASELGEADEAFLRGKLHAARFFAKYELPKIHWKADLLESLDDTTLSMEQSWF